MHITFKQLVVFLAVYKTGSTMAAAQQMKLSQSAVSMSLGTLERQLGTQLFDRAGKQLIPGQQAHLFRTYAEELVSRANNLEDMFSENFTRLKLGASTTIGNYLLPHMIQKFRQQHANVEISLHIHNTVDICKGLLNYDYDLGFIEGPNHYPELVSTHWKEDKLVLFSAYHSQWVDYGKDSLSTVDLESIPLVLREQGSGTREMVDHLLLRHLSKTNVLELGNSEAIKQAVVHDMGLGCLSLCSLHDLIELKRIRIIHVENLGDLCRDFSFVEYPPKYTTPVQKEFLTFCKQQLK